MATSEMEPWGGRIRPRLRAETEALHRTLEHRLDLLGPGLTRARYLHVLRAFLGYYAPLEERLAAFPSDLPPSPWSGRLRADLRALGVSHDSLPRCAALPPLEGRAHRAGCLYVLEGAALGGRVIARELRLRLGIGPEAGAAFFAGEGAATGERWTRFLGWLEAQALACAADDEIVDAARATFRTFGDWLERHGVLR